MEARLGPHVLHRKLLAVLIAEDGLVLGPVVAEEPADIRRAGDKPHVQQQNDDLGETLGEVSDHIALRERLNEADDQRGQEDEEKEGQQDAQHDGDADDDLLSLLEAEMLLDPFVELVRLALLLDRDEVGGIGQGLHALDHGLDKGDVAADERQTQDGIFVPDEADVLDLFHEAVLGAADDGLLAGPAHHDPFDQGLTADGCAKTGCIALVLRHDKIS